MNVASKAVGKQDWDAKLSGCATWRRQIACRMGVGQKSLRWTVHPPGEMPSSPAGGGGWNVWAPCWWERTQTDLRGTPWRETPPGGREFYEGGRRGSASPRGWGVGEDCGQWRPGTAEGEEQRPELGVGSRPGNGKGCPRLSAPHRPAEPPKPRAIAPRRWGPEKAEEGVEGRAEGAFPRAESFPEWPLRVRAR